MMRRRRVQQPRCVSNLMDILVRLSDSVFTLYMLLILLRWLGPWIGLELPSSRLRWACKLTDPLIDWMRRILPSMGSMDFGPIAAFMTVWVLRSLSKGILLSIGVQG